MTNERILIVEDSSFIAARLRKTLTRLGYAVPVVVASGEEAIQQAIETRPDLVLMDIQLAGKLDGIEAAGQIRARLDLPVIYLTTYADNVLLQRAKLTEPYSYLIKPVQDKELYATIEMALYRHQLETRRKQAEKELTKYRDRLEELVEERTAELTEAIAEAKRLNEQLHREIAERKQTEESLRESEEKYRALSENSPNGIFISDAERFIYVNQRLCEITDFSKDELLNMPDPTESLFPPEERKRVLAYALSRLSGEPTPTTYGVRGIRKDKEESWLRLRVSPIVLLGRKVLQGTVEDITERKQAEGVLRASEERFRSTFEQAAVGIVHATLEGRFLRVNQRFCEIVGYTQDEMLALTFQEITYPDDLDADLENVRRVLAGEIETFSMEKRYIHRDGSIVWVNLTVSLVRGRLGVPEYFMGVIEDITERKQAEAEIARLQHLLQSIANSMPSALIALDSKGQVLLWNPAAQAMTGRATGQVQGQSLWQTCPELARYREVFEQVLQEGQVVHWRGEPLATEMGAVYHDVDVFPLETNAMDSTSSPQVEGVVLRIDDVTRRVQLEEMMLQSAKMAIIGGLAAGVAHEINNPLGAMMQSAQVLQMALDTRRSRTRKRLQRYGVDPEGLGYYLQDRGLMDYLEGIRASGGRAAKIVSSLLNFSRQTSFQVRPYDLNALVEQALELAATDYDLKKKYDFRDIEIVREFAPDLPEVVCDGQQIQQVVLNLVRNAAQAMAAERSEWRMANGEYQPRLTLRTAYREEIVNRKSKIVNRMVRLEVEDNGPGIPEAVRARLFEPFFTTKEVGEGTGLGLWLCWSIVVERHGGQIWAEPVVEAGPATPKGGSPERRRGKRSRRSGTRFVLELPLAS